MVNYDEIMKEAEQQQNELQFSAFTSETAMDIDLSLIERAKKENEKIAIDVTINGHQLFHFSCEGTSPNNDQWITRKSKIVNRFHKSSYYLWAQLEKDGRAFEDVFFASPLEYSARGGAFPITIKNVGVVGTITVSGMAHAMDNQWIVDALKQSI